ncbi:MAG: glucosamine-6-phosphate deaminase, partial [bacterium]
MIDTSQNTVERYFLRSSPLPIFPKNIEKISTLVVDNYVSLGQLTALRFLEWVMANPEGVIALPTGKTPEFFIKWVNYYLSSWKRECDRGILGRIGFKKRSKPDFRGLHFIQLDEFFPMDPKHERSFNYFVSQYYLQGFKMDKKKAFLIDTYRVDEIMKKLIGNIDNIEEAFADGPIDFSLRERQPASDAEELKKLVIQYYDQFCEDYENKIRSLGGIGFFLGGIGPDGHVAFNIRGTSHNSVTRLTNLNYESQAAAAADLGGIEIVRKKAVITIGLETILFNPRAVAIIMAAGEAKAKVVADALQNDPSIEYPASALQKLAGARFYLTSGAASKLKERSRILLQENKHVGGADIERLIIDGAIGVNTNLKDLTVRPAKYLSNKDLALAQELSQKNISQLSVDAFDSLTDKINQGLTLPKHERILHMAPHHDDIELAYFPMLHHLVRSQYNENIFCYCTSGFTSVTNSYVIAVLQNLSNAIKGKYIYKYSSKKEVSDITLAEDDITGY